MSKEFVKRGAVVVLALLTVIGMTATPVLANDNTATDDCDLVDVDGDDNSVNVDIQQENSNLNINCGDGGSGGDAGGGGADDAGGDSGDTSADDGSTADEGSTKEIDVNVNGEDVDTSQQADDSDGDGGDGADGSDGVDGSDGADGSDDADGSDSTDGSDDANDDGMDGGDGADGDNGGDGSNGADDGDGDANGGDDSADTGDNDQSVGDIDNSSVLQYLLDQDFIDQSEVNAAINNENISNSTIVNNIVNGDQTINLSSVYVDKSVTNVDKSTTIEVYNNGTINVINEDGPGDVETPGDDGGTDNGTDDGTGDGDGPGDDNGTDNGTDDGNGSDGGAGAADISVTKTADDAVLPVDSELPVNTGIIVNFTVSVTNNGPDTATDVVVNDEMPLLDDTNLGDLETSAIVLVSSDSDDGSYDPATGNYTVDSLASGETAEVAFTTVLVQVGNDPVENTATLVSSTPDDTNPSNNVGETDYQTLVGLITEQLAGPFEGNDVLNTALDALGIDDLTEFLEDEILAGNLNLTELVDTLDNDNPVSAVIGLLEDLTGQDAPGVGPTTSATPSPTDGTQTASDTATQTETGTATDQTTTASQGSTTVASSTIPFPGVTVGLMTVLGLFGSVLMLRRD